MLQTNFELTQLKSSERNTQWNPDTNRFLFLTGKPARLNRAFLLKKIMDAGLKNHCVWSLCVSQKSRYEVQKILDLDDGKFQEFLDLYSVSPDGVKPSESEYYRPFPYDHGLYKNTSFRIIAETQFNDTRAWVTEKTWITVANHHPFIMAGNVHTLEKLKSKGLKTFENYLSICDYDSIQSPLQRIDSIVINARDWLQTIKSKVKSIESDILHNCQVYDQLIQKNMMIILEICNNHKISLETLCQSGYFSDLVDRQWLLFYNSVKDQSWPCCFSARHLDRLPLSIRQELIDVFGFNLNNFL